MGVGGGGSGGCAVGVWSAVYPGSQQDFIAI